MHGPSWQLLDVEVVDPNGNAAVFAAATEQEQWLDAKHGDKKVHRVLQPQGGLADTPTGNAASATTRNAAAAAATAAEESARLIELERQRVLKAEEDGALARQQAEEVAAAAERRIREAEARAAQAEANAKQMLMEQLQGQMQMLSASSPAGPKGIGGGASLTSSTPTKFGRRSGNTTTLTPSPRQQNSSSSINSSSNPLNASVVDWAASVRLGDGFVERLGDVASSMLDLQAMDAEDVASLGLKRMEEKRFSQALAMLRE